MRATHPGGTANINGLTVQKLDTAIGALGGFNPLTLTVPVTITSGDFAVGFSTRNPANIFPVLHKRRRRRIHSGEYDQPRVGEQLRDPRRR